ncbi:trichohyalin-like [Xyrichtys novacula]|uniref:Trichohyalin-like n=1 Tax=Xyrichtys novacula TaxID=13765 RepID=A0AAV1FKJ7_XYRNO|nr:trichohyalin-like [Xyrichtys novacula]
MSRAIAPEFVGPLACRPMAPLQQELASARAEIINLRNEQSGEQAAWMRERVKLGYRIHNGKYKVNRLEGLIDVRENGFKEELQSNVQTIERMEAEIQRLNSSLKLKDEQVELIQHLQKEQEEKMWAQLKEERQKVHELREQLFQASQENLKAVSLSKNNETMLRLTKQQLEQRDNHIMELRREKEGVTQRLIETTTQLQNNEKQRKDLEEENQILKTRVSELEKRNKDLVGKEETLTFRVEEAETAKERVIEKEKTLTDRIQELEEEKRELTHLVSLKKRRFLSRVFQKETEEEKTLRKQLKEKKKELRQLREREKAEEREQEEEQREQEEREHEEEKTKNQDRGEKRVKKGLWTLRKKKNRDTQVEEVPNLDPFTPTL